MSRVTLKEAIRATLADLMAQDQRVFVLGEDVGVLGGAFGVTAGLLDRFGPERVRDAPRDAAAPPKSIMSSRRLMGLTPRPRIMDEV